MRHSVGALCEPGVLRFLWFRGDQDGSPLLPRALRTYELATGGKHRFNGFYIYNAFLSLYRNYTSERFEKKSVELLSFMQHYDIPTRLLDWTESAVFGLYFAVEKSCQRPSVA